MAHRVGAQPIKTELVAGARVQLPDAPESMGSMPVPGEDIDAPQLQPGNPVQDAIDSNSSIQPTHALLTANPLQPSVQDSTKLTSDVIAELAALRSSKVPLAVKALIAGGGLVAAIAFAKSTLLSPPDNMFGGILIGLVALLTLPVVGAEFTNRRLAKEFGISPIEPDHLPTVDRILEEGYTAEQFGAFVENDLLPRVPVGHFRTMANESGTCLHDIQFWARGEQHFGNTKWQTVHKVIEALGVGEEISRRVKAALLVIERDTTLDKASLPEIHSALAELAE